MENLIKSQNSRPDTKRIVAVLALFIFWFGLGVSYGNEGFRLVSEYEIPVELRECDSSNPQVKFIRNNNDWSDINNSSYCIFCVEPGDYSSISRVTVTADGAPENPRYLMYFDPANPNDNTHPVHMTGAQQAVISTLRFEGASYWIVDRIVVRGGVSNQIRDNSSHNIFNRMLFEQNTSNPMLHFMGTGSDYNVIQNSVLRDMEIPFCACDRHCVGVSRGADHSRIVNNEIYDCPGDCIHIEVVNPNEGTIIENNDLYVTSDLYSDCNGNLDPNGSCAGVENAIDIKWVTTDPNEDKWTKILNNRIWGYRNYDGKIAGSGAGLGAPPVVTSCQDYPREYVLIQNNIIFDSPQDAGAIHFGGNSKMYPYDPTHFSVIGNLIYDAGRYGIHSYVADKSEVYFNTIIGSQHWAYYDSRYSFNNDIRCNVFINSGDFAGGAGGETQFDYNAFYNTQMYSTGNPSNDLVYDSANDAAHDEYCFTIKHITNPTQHCIPHAKITANSPHIGQCEATIGSRADIGVDNRVNAWTDLLGNQRDNEPDMGAFEYGGSPSAIPGDLNGDEEVNASDIQFCVNVFLGTETQPDVVQKAKAVAEPQDECNLLDIQENVNVFFEN